LTEEIDPMILEPIGVIHTPYRRREDIPRQGRLSLETCEIEVFPRYSAGLRDVELCSHLFVLFWLHLSDRTKLIGVPPHDGREHGVFATRSPHRPNPIAVDIVELLEVRGNRLAVKGMDALDGSILLDIKPYFAGIDSFPQARVGWQRDEGVQRRMDESKESPEALATREGARRR
jgi:tRNA-Thr(GGU) m(6)t(6)A37 methyltransferase TsaA